MNTTSTAILRILALVVVLFGMLLYLYLAYSAVVPGWYQTPGIHSSWREELGYVVQDVVFMPGLPPLIVAIYFLLLGRTTQDWLAGFGFVVGFVVFHYVVAVWMAHGSPTAYLPMMLAELLAAIGLIWCWQRKRRNRTAIGSAPDSTAGRVKD